MRSTHGEAILAGRCLCDAPTTLNTASRARGRWVAASCCVSAAWIEEMSSSKLSLHTHGARVTSMSASACGIVNRARARAAKLPRPASGTGTMNGAATRHGQCTSASIQSIDGIMLAVLGQVAEVLQQLLRNAKSFRCAVFNGARAPTPSVHQSRRTGERAVGRRGDAAKPVLLTFRENFSSMP